MQHRRAEERKGEPSWLVGPDRSQSKATRDLYKMGGSFYKMLLMLAEAPISSIVVHDAEFEIVKANLNIWLGRIHEMTKLTVKPESEEIAQEEREVTAIYEPELTVNAVTGLTVNSELEADQGQNAKAE